MEELILRRRIHDVDDDEDDERDERFADNIRHDIEANAYKVDI